MQVITIETASLGDRSYIVHDGRVGLVVDPQRDIDRVVEAARSAGVEITHVAETHVHNDYVSGGLTLARVSGATYLHAADEPLRFDHHAVSDGDVIDVGSMRVEVRHTPGHTPHHLSYVVTAAGDAPAAFTGGSMLYGTVGRTDLIGSDATDELAHAQYRSVHALADSLPDETLVYPTHGFGSFCASAVSDRESDGTLGGERSANIALTADDEDRFVAQLVAGLDAFPTYYAQMGPLNTAGATAIDLSPPAPVDPVELARRIHRGEWVVDLRPRREFASTHVSGTIGVELAGGFSTYLGWLLPWGMPVTLLADDADEISEAQVQLVRIGIDRPTGAADGGIDSWSADADRSSYEITTFAGLREVRGPTILDTRRDGEHAAGHLEGSTHIPLHELLGRLDEVPDGTVHVHCRSGYRASIAASLLDRAGHDVVLVDDSFDDAAESGIALVGPDAS
ncbi:rhodanese-like domain-containing protein [Ilumatobacter sp.]|uniref:rhodanese-like domain-containing protein n=1 Tax=Ilumatobacter sp. TaxID=1967498 RepID=UPI003B52211C